MTEATAVKHLSLAYPEGLKVCPSYLNELVILSNGDVTTCCLDAKGENTLGNCNDTSLMQLWGDVVMGWHQKNIYSNLEGSEWQSNLCNQCFAGNYMRAFGVKSTTNYDEVQHFHQVNAPFPRSLVIEPVSACNYRCWGCYTGLGELNRTTKTLQFDKFVQNILPIVPHLHLVRLYNYGETFLHPRIIDIIAALRSANPILRIDISTNGVPMKPKICDALIESQVNYLIVSLHGGHTQQGLMRYARNGPDINAIAENIRYLVTAKRAKNSKLPWISLKSILFDWNDSSEEMEDFLRFGNELGVDFAGWDLNSSDPNHSSKRIVPGSAPHRELQEKRLMQDDFYRSFPVWPD